MTPTAEASHLVLPTTTLFEQMDIVTSYWHKEISINEQAIPPFYESRSEWNIMTEMANRLNEYQPGICSFPIYSSEEEYLNHQFNDKVYQVYRVKSISDLRKKDKKSHNQDMIAWEDRRFPTASGKFQFSRRRDRDAFMARGEPAGGSEPPAVSRRWARRPAHRPSRGWSRRRGSRRGRAPRRAPGIPRGRGPRPRTGAVACWTETSEAAAAPPSPTTPAPSRRPGPAAPARPPAAARPCVPRQRSGSSTVPSLRPPLAVRPGALSSSRVVPPGRPHIGKLLRQLLISVPGRPRSHRPGAGARGPDQTPPERATREAGRAGRQRQDPRRSRRPNGSASGERPVAVAERGAARAPRPAGRRDRLPARACHRRDRYIGSALDARGCRARPGNAESWTRTSGRVTWNLRPTTRGAVWSNAMIDEPPGERAIPAGRSSGPRRVLEGGQGLRGRARTPIRGSIGDLQAPRGERPLGHERGAAAIKVDGADRAQRAHQGAHLGELDTDAVSRLPTIDGDHEDPPVSRDPHVGAGFAPHRPGVDRSAGSGQCTVPEREVVAPERLDGAAPSRGSLDRAPAPLVDPVHDRGLQEHPLTRLQSPCPMILGIPDGEHGHAGTQWRIAGTWPHLQHLHLLQPAGPEDVGQRQDDLEAPGRGLGGGREPRGEEDRPGVVAMGVDAVNPPGDHSAGWTGHGLRARSRAHRDVHADIVDPGTSGPVDAKRGTGACLGHEQLPARDRHRLRSRVGIDPALRRHVPVGGHHGHHPRTAQALGQPGDTLAAHDEVVREQRSEADGGMVRLHRRHAHGLDEGLSAGPHGPHAVADARRQLDGRGR